jgi:hypothetical protein
MRGLAARHRISSGKGEKAMSPPLKTLTIEHLRGSVIPFSLPFEKDKQLTVIYGENGTGKSTICDAFEFLGKGKVGSLENRGLGKTDRYWHSFGKSPGDVAVKLETATSSCRAIIGSNEVLVVPADMRPRVEVLRRKQILDLIEAEPGKRYAAINRFVDVTGIEASEASLRQLLNDLTKSREVAVARVQENEDAISQFWEAAGKPSPNMFGWAETEAVRDSGTFDAELGTVSLLQSAFSQLNVYPDRLGSAKDSIDAARELEQAAQENANQLLKGISEDAGEVVEILQAARKYFTKHPTLEACPLCDSAEKADGLAVRVDHRLTVFTEFQAAQAKLAQAAQLVQKAEQESQTWLDAARAHAAEFEQCHAAYVWPGDVPLPESPAPKDPSLLSAWLMTNSHLPTEWKKAEAVRHDKKQFLETLKKALTTWRENTKAQKELDGLLPRIAKALEIVEAERKKFTDAVLSKIADEVGRLYEIVHPGEGLNKISLQLDPKKRASLEIGASFCGKNTRPQAYFSDSHLDTLGLCVFLALSAMENPGSTILVLDDVLASVDEPHVDRLIEMLYSEALKFRHCVITTHYRPWKQKLRWGWLQNGQCQFIELTRWTASSGLTLIRSIPDLERLRDLLAENPPDCQLICAKAGVILEAALDFLTLQYECAVPRKQSGLYTLGELLPATEGKLRDALRVDVLTGTDSIGESIYKTVKLAPFLDELTRIAQARNVFGCHFNQISFDLLDTDALGFGQHVLGLMDVLVDAEAGWPKNGKSGEYWQTAGATRRLRPYKKPA